MARQRKKKSSFNFKIVFVFIACAAAFYWWEGRENQKKKKSSLPPAQVSNIQTNTETKSLDTQNQGPIHAKARDFFPSNVWEEDEKQLKFEHGGKQYQLISLGIIPPHTKKIIKNTDSLKPYLLLLEQNPKGWQKVCEFSFDHSGLKETLVGLPRISKTHITDLDQDSNIEILVYLDTKGSSGEALAVIQLKNNKFEWIKKNNSELAIWPIGASSQSSRKINLSSQGINGKKKLVEQLSLFDPQKPELGVQSRTKEWVLKENSFVEKQSQKVMPGEL